MAAASEPASASVMAKAMSVLAGREVRDPALLLLVGPGEEDRQGAEALHGEDEARRRADAADLLDREAGGQEVAAEPAEPLREVEREEVVRRQQLLDVPGELGRPVDLRRARGDLLVGELAHGVAQEPLLVGQAWHGGGLLLARAAGGGRPWPGFRSRRARGTRRRRPAGPRTARRAWRTPRRSG